jgi:hypothetical protein
MFDWQVIVPCFNGRIRKPCEMPRIKASTCPVGVQLEMSNHEFAFWDFDGLASSSVLQLYPAKVFFCSYRNCQNRVSTSELNITQPENHLLH